MEKTTINFRVQLPAVIKKRNDWYIASCPILDVQSQGKTKKKAIDNLTEALTAFLLSCYDRGTLDEVLKESGFESAYGVRKPKPSKKIRTIDVSIPFRVPVSPVV